MTETRLFVYGTLMPGQERHDLLAGWVGEKQPGTLNGWLFGLPEGYPALVLPAHTLHGELLPGEPRPVHGVLCTCRDDASLFETLDRYEDSVPGDPDSLYVRARVDVAEDGEGVVRAWAYVWNPARLVEILGRGMHLPEGRWAPRSVAPR